AMQSRLRKTNATELQTLAPFNSGRRETSAFAPAKARHFITTMEAGALILTSGRDRATALKAIDRWREAVEPALVVAQSWWPSAALGVASYPIRTWDCAAGELVGNNGRRRANRRCSDACAVGSATRI